MHICIYDEIFKNFLQSRQTDVYSSRLKHCSYYGAVILKGLKVNWKQFKDEMPQDNTCLLICGKINTDPLSSTGNDLVYMEFINFHNGLLVSDSDVYEDYEPDPEDYWIYKKDIPIPFDDKPFTEGATMFKFLLLAVLFCVPVMAMDTTIQDSTDFSTTTTSSGRKIELQNRVAR